MANIIPVNTKADAARLATATLCPDHVPASQPRAGLEPDCPVAVPTRDPQLFGQTMFFADYFDATRKLRYVNCGHCPAFLVRADGICEKLGPTATVLGIFENWNCTVGEATMSSGDILVAYSDGVTEAQSSSDELFGDERLLARLLL